MRIVIALDLSPDLNPNALAPALVALCVAVAQSKPDEYTGFATDLWMLSEYARSGSLLPLPNPIGISIRVIGGKHDQPETASPAA